MEIKDVEFTKEGIHKILLHQVLHNGESVWEQFDSIFDGEQENYLEFLVKENYITKEQQENWLRIREEVYDGQNDCSEYSHIEDMTFTSNDDFPVDVGEFYELYDEDYTLDSNKAKELGAINVPILIEAEDVSQYNEIYWEQVLLIIAHYMSQNVDMYKARLIDIVN